MSDNKDDKLGMKILSEDGQDAASNKQEKEHEQDPVQKKVKADSDPLTAGVENFYDFTVEDLPPGSDDLYRPKAKDEKKKEEEPLVMEADERIDIAEIQGFGREPQQQQSRPASTGSRDAEIGPDDDVLEMEEIEMPSMTPDLDEAMPSSTQRPEPKSAASQQGAETDEDVLDETLHRSECAKHASPKNSAPHRAPGRAQ